MASAVPSRQHREIGGSYDEDCYDNIFDTSTAAQKENAQSKMTKREMTAQYRR